VNRASSGDFRFNFDKPSADLAVLVNHHLTENQVQVGFSYKIDTFAPAPVVANFQRAVLCGLAMTGGARRRVRFVGKAFRQPMHVMHVEDGLSRSG
jgi:hypothetical protein